MSARAALALAACAACGSGARSDGTRGTGPDDNHQERGAGPDTDQQTPTVDAAMNATSVDLNFVGMDPARPPMIRLRFDVTLRNRAAEPRWFLLPRDAERAPASGGGVDGVEVDALGQPPVLVGRFQGTGSVQAVLLPGNGTVTLRRFTIRTFEDLPDGPASLQVVIARDLKVGGEDAAAWFKADPTAPAGADVSEDGQKRHGSRHTPDRGEVPLTFTEEQRVTADFVVSAAPVR